MFSESIMKTLESTKKREKTLYNFISEILNLTLVLRIAGIFKDFRNFIFQVKYHKTDSN